MLRRLFYLMIIAGSIAFVQAAEPDPEKMSFKGFIWPNQTPAQFAASCILSVSATPRPQEYTTENVDNSLIVCGT